MKVVLRHMNEPVPDPSQAAPDRNIPASLAAVAVRAMAKERADRFQTAQEMSLALQAALQEMTTGPSDSLVCPGCGELSPSTNGFADLAGRDFPLRRPGRPRPDTAAPAGVGVLCCSTECRSSPNSPGPGRTP